VQHLKGGVRGHLLRTAALGDRGDTVDSLVLLQEGLLLRLGHRVVGVPDVLLLGIRAGVRAAGKTGVALGLLVGLPGVPSGLGARADLAAASGNRRTCNRRNGESRSRRGRGCSRLGLLLELRREVQKQVVDVASGGIGRVLRLCHISSVELLSEVQDGIGVGGGGSSSVVSVVGVHVE